MTPLEHAQAYATAGYRVFPLRPHSKAPATRNGLHDATTDTAQIAAWWTAKPTAGIGIALGHHPTHGYVFAVDIDDHGADGQAVWQDICDDYGWTEPDDTPEQITGGGGRHLLFSSPHEIRNGELGPDVQTRGEGGYIVAEPSHHDETGIRYVWTEGREPWTCDPTPAPAWLLARLAPPEPIIRERTVAPGDDTRPGTRWMAEATWASILEPDGWTHAGHGHNVDAYWTRPGKQRGISASQGYGGSDVLKVFTSSVPWLTAERTYDKLGYVAARDHGGDITAASRWAAGEMDRTGDRIGPTIATPPKSRLPRGGVVGQHSIPISSHDGTEAVIPIDTDRFPLDASIDTDRFPLDASITLDDTEPTTHDTPDTDDAGWPIAGYDEIAAILSGDYEPPTPSLMRRQAGGALLYPGKVHSLAGEPGAGKTWIALAGIAEVLTDGGQAMLVDYEDRPDTAVRRLASMGVDHCAISTRFHYVTPTIAYADGMLPNNVIDTAANCELVVTDSVGEALSHSGMNQNNDDEVAAWMRNTARRLADGGAAVLVLDHVTKDTETRGRFAIGSQRKLAAIDGIAYMAKAIKAASKDKEGVIRVTVSKDRGGHYQHGTAAAVVHIVPNGDDNIVTIDEPHDHDDDTDEWMPTALMEKVSRHLEHLPAGLSKRQIRDQVKGSKDHIELAVEHLVRLGHVTLEDGPRGAVIHRHATPFRDIDIASNHDPVAGVADRGGTVAAPHGQTPDDDRGVWRRSRSDPPRSRSEDGQSSPQTKNDSGGGSPDPTESTPEQFRIEDF